MIVTRSAYYQVTTPILGPLIAIPGVFAFAYRYIRAVSTLSDGPAVPKRLSVWGQIWYEDPDIADLLIKLNVNSYQPDVDLYLRYKHGDLNRTKQFRRVIFAPGGGSFTGTLQQPVNTGQQVLHWMPFLVSMRPYDDPAEFVITLNE